MQTANQLRQRIEAGYEQSPEPSVSVECLFWADQATATEFANQVRVVRPRSILHYDGIRVLLDTSDPTSRATLFDLQVFTAGFLGGAQYAREAMGRPNTV